MLLQGLPLKEDMEENETVYKCIVQLITAKNPVVSAISLGFNTLTHTSYTCTCSIQDCDVST